VRKGFILMLLQVFIFNFVYSSFFSRRIIKGMFPSSSCLSLGDDKKKIHNNNNVWNMYRIISNHNKEKEHSSVRDNKFNGKVSSFFRKTF
jgi:hypothetical protein